MVDAQRTEDLLRSLTAAERAGFHSLRPVLMLLAVHHRAGQSLLDYVVDTGLTKTATHRAAEKLEGFMMITITPDPRDRRRRILRLTPRGLAVVQEVVG